MGRDTGKRYLCLAVLVYLCLRGINFTLECIQHGIRILCSQEILRFFGEFREKEFLLVFPLLFQIFVPC